MAARPWRCMFLTLSISCLQKLRSPKRARPRSRETHHSKLRRAAQVETYSSARPDRFYGFGHGRARRLSRSPMKEEVFIGGWTRRSLRERSQSERRQVWVRARALHSAEGNHLARAIERLGLPYRDPEALAPDDPLAERIGADPGDCRRPRRRSGSDTRRVAGDRRRRRTAAPAIGRSLPPISRRRRRRPDLGR